MYYDILYQQLYITIDVKIKVKIYIKRLHSECMVGKYIKLTAFILNSINHGINVKY